MTADEILLDIEERMEKAVGKLKGDLTGIRTGRANPGLIDSLKVEVYGSSVPIKQLATVGTPDPTQIVIRAFDPGTLKDIEKAILASDLGFTPQNDGRVIRLNVPALSTEVRHKMVGRIREEKAKTLSEDERDDVKKEIQDLIKQYESQANNLAQAREKDVLED
jgi:ribosome recycling factor